MPVPGAVETPRMQTFFVERDGEPDPNFVKRVDLEIFATSAPEPVLVDGNVTYELEILNRGPDRATDIEVTVGLRDGFGTFVSSSVPCESAPEGIVCTLGQTLPKKGRTAVTVTYRALFSGSFIIDVGVRSTTGGDTNDGNNNKTTSTTVIDPDE